MTRVLYVGRKLRPVGRCAPGLHFANKASPFEERLVDIRQPQRNSELGKIAAFSPPGAVPVLVDGDVVIFDSLAIMEYASELGDRRLLPNDLLLRARTHSLLAWMHSGLSGLCNRLSFESTFYPVRRAATSTEQQEAARVLAVWSEELAKSGGPYLTGDLSLADLAFVPVVRRFQAHEIALDAWPHVHSWAQRLMARPAVVEWMREAEALPPIVLADY